MSSEHREPVEIHPQYSQPVTGQYPTNARQATSPAALVFQDRVFVFYRAPGDHDNPFWVAVYDGNTWAGPINIRDGPPDSQRRVAGNTSPCVVVFRAAMYLFHVRTGVDGVWYTRSTNGTSWSQRRRIPVTEHVFFDELVTPSAVVHEGLLWLFWGKTGCYFASSTFDGTGWEVPADLTGISEVQNGACSPVVLHGVLYLFYNALGAAGTRVMAHVNKYWTVPPPSMSAALGNMGIQQSTGPFAFIAHNSSGNSRLAMLWVGSDERMGEAGIMFTSTNTPMAMWTISQAFSRFIGPQQMTQFGSPCAVSYRGAQYVFWIGRCGGVWMCKC